MIVAKANPTGPDYWIDRLQRWIEPILFSGWGLDPENEEESGRFKFFPRVNRNQDKAAGFIAELYLGNGEYKEVYWDDTLWGCTWFGLGPRISHEVDQVYNVHLVTFANLTKLYPAVQHRADAEIRQVYMDIFRAPILGFTLDSTEIWLQNVLREYPGSRRDDRLRKADMGDVHAFRLNLSLRFDPLQACANPSL